ncbi:MAK10-like protein [Tanacetum coccineum]
MTNKIDTFLKAINDRMTGALASDPVKNPKLNVNPTSSVSSARSYPMEDPQSSSHPLNSINAIKTCCKQTNNFQKNKLQMVIKIGTPKPEEPKKTLKDELEDLHLNLPVLEVLAHAPMYNAIMDKYVESLELGKRDSNPFDTLADLGSCMNLISLYLFKKLKIGLLEETDHVFRLANGTKSYPIGIVKNVEVHIGKLKLLEDFYAIDMEKDPATPLLVGRGFLATASAVIDCRKAKIAVGEGVTSLIFRVKEIDLGDEDVPYWTTLGKRESYEPRPSTDGIGARPPYYAKKDFMDYHLLGEWEIAKDTELNPFKDSEELIEKRIDWNRPPKEEDGVWHIRIELIDPDGEKFNKTFQSVPTNRKLSEKENPSEIIDLDHFHNS